MLDGSAQFLGSRVFAMPGGQQRILLFLDRGDERLDLNVKIVDSVLALGQFGFRPDHSRMRA